MTILERIATWIGLAVGVPALGLDTGSTATCIGCGRRSQATGVRMITGPEFGICEQCAGEATALVGRTGPGAAYPDNDNILQCHFCGTERASASGLVGWPRGAICKNCLDLSHEIFRA